MMRMLEAWSQTFTKPYVNLCKTHGETTTARLMFSSICTQYSWCFVSISSTRWLRLFLLSVFFPLAFDLSRCCCIHHRKTNMYHHCHRRQSAVAPWPEGLRKLPAAARNGAGQPNWFFSHKKCGKDLASWICWCQWLWFSRPLPKKNIWLLTWLVWLMPFWTCRFQAVVDYHR